MSKGRSQPLGNFFIVTVASAGAAFFLRARAAGLLAPYLRKQGIVAPSIAAYALVFAAAFLLLSFLSHHVSLRFSLKAQGLEKTQGLAPKAARVVLAAVIFAVPLVFAHGAEKGKTSLESLIEASDKKAAAVAQPGYKKDDRAKLNQLMGKQ